MLAASGLLILGGFLRLLYELGMHAGWAACYQQFFLSGDYEVRPKRGAGIGHS